MLCVHVWGGEQRVDLGKFKKTSIIYVMIFIDWPHTLASSILDKRGTFSALLQFCLRGEKKDKYDASVFFDLLSFW